ncbi:MAG: hypothetical protein Q7S53_05215 [bacterium]|nr:hypothetical protein [bacterium]
MKETNETTAEESNEELSTLKESLREALNDGDMQRADELRDQISPHLEVLKEEIEISPETARKIMGEGGYFGPEEAEKAFKLNIDAKDIPKIPFDREDLESAKNLGDILVLRVDKDSDGDPLTMERMEEITSFDGISPSRYAHNWWWDEAVFNRETPRTGWAIISGRPMMATAGTDYLEQTEILVGSFFANEFLGRSLPQEYQEAVRELEEKKDKIKDLMSQQILDLTVSKTLVDLKINRLLRPTPVEVAYDRFLHDSRKKKREKPLYGGNTIWTNGFMPDRGIVGMGGQKVFARPANGLVSGDFFAAMSRRS